MSYESSALNTSVSVGLSTTWVLNPNPNRKRVTFINTDAAETIYLYKGGGAAASKGITLTPYGSMEDSRDFQGYIYRGTYTAIATGAATVLSVCEES